MRARHRHWVAPAPLPPDLFAPPSVAVDTSRLAAARIQGRTNRLREAVILFIRAQGARGATAGEIELGLGLSGSTVRPRLLEAQGLAKWAPGLPARIQRSPEVRKRMHCYVAIEP